MPPSIEVARLPHAADLPLPSYATAGAAGMDLFAAVEAPLAIAPGARALVPTGLRLALPPGHELRVRPRSGLALRHGVVLPNSPGTMDEDFRGYPTGQEKSFDELQSTLKNKTHAMARRWLARLKKTTPMAKPAAEDAKQARIRELIGRIDQIARNHNRFKIEYDALFERNTQLEEENACLKRALLELAPGNPAVVPLRSRRR